jgi:hypothetical protein
VATRPLCGCSHAPATCGGLLGKCFSQARKPLAAENWACSCPCWRAFHKQERTGGQVQPEFTTSPLMTLFTNGTTSSSPATPVPDSLFEANNPARNGRGCSLPCVEPFLGRSAAQHRPVVLLAPPHNGLGTTRRLGLECCERGPDRLACTPMLGLLEAQSGGHSCCINWPDRLARSLMSAFGEALSRRVVSLVA